MHIHFSLCALVKISSKLSRGFVMRFQIFSFMSQKTKYINKKTMMYTGKSSLIYWDNNSCRGAGSVAFSVSLTKFSTA